MIIELTEQEIRRIRLALQIARDRSIKRSVEISELTGEKWVTMADKYSEVDEKLKKYQQLLH